VIEYSEGDRVLWDEPLGCPVRGEIVEVYRCDHGTVITHYAVQLDPPASRVSYAMPGELHPTGPTPVPPGEPVEDGNHEWAHA
jgi:hypothetical protein